MSELSELNNSALHDFHSARRKAELQSLMARLSGRPSELLSYDEVRKRLRAIEDNTQKLEVIPLDAIIGSVGRYSDFNRLFQPLNNSAAARWTGVNRAITGLRGVPPIEVYRIGETYFVKDGNHRVSVARQLGFKNIEAYVTEVHSPVPIGPDLDFDDLILKAEQAEFLEKTQLHRLRPESDLSVTVPGQYEVLLEHIAVHQYFMGLDLKRDVAYEEAVTHWYDEVYLPVIKMIEARAIAEDFPGRTATDLYIWLANYRIQLNRELGWDLEASTIAQHTTDSRGKSRTQLAKELDPRSYPIDDLVVAISGTDVGWNALEQAMIMAKKEKVNLYAVHALKDATSLNSDEVLKLKREFQQRLAEKGLKGQLAIEIGQPLEVVAERAKWGDVIIANLAHPPGVSFRLKNAFQAFVRRVPKPILAVPGVTSPLNKAMLAYNASPKADIALFAAAALASRWGIRLVVVSVQEFGKEASRLLDRAKEYLEAYGIEASFVATEGKVVPAILELLEAEQADLLLVGGYEYSTLFEPILGGVLDEILRRIQVPMLICQ
ncbi:MAG: universal stress protein [Trueperaceae bacterium]|nr:universal stress protein [Trueperaceae bacterium]